MAANENSPVAMTARIDLTVSDAETKRSMDKASRTVKQSLDRIESQASQQVQSQLAQRTQKIANSLKTATQQISGILKTGLTVGVGAGTSAITAFLRSNTAEALRFKSRLADVQTALGGVGQKLAYNVKFGGKSMYEWAEKLTHFLNNLSTDQLQKAADIVKNIAITLAGLKAFSMGAGLVGSLAQVSVALNAGKAAGAGAQALGAGAQAASTVTGAGAGTLSGAVGATAFKSAVLGTSTQGTAAAAAALAAAKGTTGEAAALAAYLRAIKGAQATTAMTTAIPGVLGSPGVFGLASGASMYAGLNIMRHTYGRRQHGYLPGWGEMPGAVRTHGMSYSGGYGDDLINGGEGGAMWMGDAKATPAEREAARRATMNRYLHGDTYQRNIKGMFGFGELGSRYSREDSSRTGDAKYAELKARIPELQQALADADVSAAEFKAARDKLDADGNRVYALGSAGFANYDQHYREAQGRGTSAQAAMSAIERMGLDEAKAKAAKKKLDALEISGATESMFKLEENFSYNRGRTAKSRMAEDQADMDRQTSITDAIKRMGDTSGSLALGVGVSSMPNLSAQRLNAAEANDKAWQETMKNLAEDQRNLTEAEAEKADRRREEDMIAKDSFDESLKAIEKVITGNESGTAAE